MAEKKSSGKADLCACMEANKGRRTCKVDAEQIGKYTDDFKSEVPDADGLIKIDPRAAVKALS